jgi:NAD(P)-dependent dehydrogenase (short-subunit alcohol dehydrogenase family)
MSEASNSRTTAPASTDAGPSFDVVGQIALVTGAARGIGRAIAIALAQAGADVALGFRDLRAGGDVADAIRALGRRALPMQMDVARPPEISAAVAQAVGHFGHIDILVNNAGINIRKPTLELSEAEWQEVMATNLTGPFLVSRAVAPQMIERGWGRIINMGSIQSFIAMPGRPAYNATKGGLMQLTRTMALEWAHQGVNVNALCPGPFDTPLNRSLRDNPAAYQAFLAKIPLGRWGDPAELGGAIIFLASEASSFVTGAALMVDGGWTVQ